MLFMLVNPLCYFKVNVHCIVSMITQCVVFNQRMFVYLIVIKLNWSVSWSVIPITPLWWLSRYSQGYSSSSWVPQAWLRMASEGCDLWGEKFNASTTKTMIVFRLHTVHRKSFPLIIGVTVLNVSWYIGRDIWFQDDFWEASSLGFQSSLSKTGILINWGRPGKYFI